MALAQQTVNAEGGSDARYSLQGLQRGDRGWTDGVYWYDSNGLSLDRPNQMVQGLAGARQLDGRDPTGAPIYASGGGGGGGGGGSGGFDYKSNPYFQQVLASVNAGGAADAASTRAAIQQALIAYGRVPTGFQDKLGALDETTKALIQKNTDTGISGYARLLEGREKGIKGLVANLSSRGMRRSGQKAYGLRENQLGFDRASADSTASLLGGIGDRYGAYAQNEAMRQRQLADAMRDVYANWYSSQSQAQPAAVRSPGITSVAQQAKSALGLAPRTQPKPTGGSSSWKAM